MKPNNEVNSGSRLGSMILDHFFMTMIAMIFFVPMMINGFSDAFTVSHLPNDNNLFNGPLSYISLLGFALYFCKDSISGRSIAKRITKLQVVDNITGEVATPLKCFIRNIFCIIWPVEVIMVLINPARRIGDLVAGTKVVAYNPVLNIQPTTDFKKVLLPLVLSFVFLLLIVLSLKSFQPAVSKTKYIISSFNERESRALEKRCNDSLSEYLSASIMVCDKIANQEGKYISVICMLKENYLQNESSSDKIRRLTLLQLFAVYPENSFTGEAQYIYKRNGAMQKLTSPIGRVILETRK